MSNNPERETLLVATFGDLQSASKHLLAMAATLRAMGDRAAVAEMTPQDIVDLRQHCPALVGLFKNIERAAALAASVTKSLLFIAEAKAAASN